MATFAYIARDSSGEKVTGRLAGASEQSVLSELQARSLAPVQVRELREQRAFGRKGVGVRALSTSYRQLSDLLRAGVPLLRALRLIGRSKANKRLAAIWAKIAEEIADGGHLAECMSANGDVFPDIQVAMVRAGERGGFLEEVLERLGNFLEHQAELRAKVVGNLVYPGVLAGVMVAVIVFALTVLVPKFESFYANMDLPLPTKILLGASDLLTNHGLIVLVATGAAIAGLVWIRRQERAQYEWARLQLRIPRIGPLARDLAVGRFARILGTMLDNGIPMLTAMQISKDAAGHPILEDAISKATEAVRSGETLSDPLAASGLFTDDVVEVIRVGESANNLPQVLGTLADTLEKRIDRQLTMVVRLMEPALLLVMGGMVFFIFGALVVPMLQMTSQV